MGSRGLKSEEKVEATSLSLLFEEQCPIYMSYGMSYDEFWYGDCYRTKFYRDAYIVKLRHKDEEFWQQGMYIYEVLCDVSPILHAFSKKGTKPLPYSSKPYTMENDSLKTSEEKKIDKKTEEENSKLVAQVFFKNWVRNTKKQFNNGGD